MKIERKCVKYGPIWAASGAVNFFGQGWPFHRWLVCLHRWVLFFLPGMSWVGVLPVYKTTTYYSNKGNMPLDPKTLMPTERFPRCIHCGPWQWLWGVALNAVGLSGPGAEDLFERGEWQKMSTPFQLSFMAIGPKESWIDQWRAYLKLLAKHFAEFQAKFGVQLNVSCPNVRIGETQTEIVKLAFAMLDVLDEFPALKELDIFVKIAVTMSPIDAVRITAHPNCAGLVVSNTTPFGWLGIPKWRWWFWFPWFRLVSPLAKFGDGGLSGAGLFPLLVKWLKEFRSIDPNSYVNAGGGILKAKQVDRLFAVGANSVSIGSIAFLRWWRMEEVIERAYLRFHELIKKSLKSKGVER